MRPLRHVTGLCRAGSYIFPSQESPDTVQYESSSDDDEENSFKRLSSAAIAEVEEEVFMLHPENDISTSVVNRAAARNGMIISSPQYKAARYIVMSGPSSRGLSMVSTQQYLNSLEEGCPVVSMRPNTSKFWADHERRQKLVLPTFGAWNKIRMCNVKHSASYTVPEHFALIRRLPDTIKHVIYCARYITLKPGQQWPTLIKVQPMQELDAKGNRIVHDVYSSDDFIHLWNALKQKECHKDKRFLPLQLFIYKANVTKLNKRSMYPTVMYLLCFPREVRKQLAVNVAFAPIVTNLSTSRRRLSKELTKLVRCSFIQQTLEQLLSPITEDYVMRANFPDGTHPSITPLLFSVVADLPEVAVLSSMRFGGNASFPCCRCSVFPEDMGRLPSEDRPVELRTARLGLSIYQRLTFLTTKQARESILKRTSLREPASALLSRFELQMDAPQLEQVLRQQNVISDFWRPFGLLSLMKFEALHNFDLGLTADLLRAIHKYFSLTVSPAQATAIVTEANAHQSLIQANRFYHVPFTSCWNGNIRQSREC